MRKKSPFASPFPKATPKKRTTVKSSDTMKDAPVVRKRIASTISSIMSPTQTLAKPTGSLGLSRLASKSIKEYNEEAAKPVEKRNIRPHPFSMQAFPACCGARVLTGFPSTFNAYQERAVELGIAETFKGYKSGQVFAILASYQTGFEKVLLKAGFERINSFGNPNHGGSECVSFVLTQTKHANTTKSIRN